MNMINKQSPKILADGALIDAWEKISDQWGLEPDVYDNWDEFCHDVVEAAFDIWDDFPGSIDCWTLVDGLAQHSHGWMGLELRTNWRDFSRNYCINEIAETLLGAVYVAIDEGQSWEPWSKCINFRDTVRILADMAFEKSKISDFSFSNTSQMGP
jgi:hypothetical protein